MYRRLVAAHLGIALLAAWSGTIAPLSAQEGGVSAVDVSALPQDPAFDRYVDIDLLADAWEEKDASLLTDLALAMAEGERILQRPRRGIAASDVFGGAIKTAAELRDATALARLTTVLGNLKRDDLLAQASIARRLASSSRTADPGLTVQADTATPATFFAMKSMLEDIASAKIAGDRAELRELSKDIADMTDLSEAQRRSLTRAATEALEILPMENDPASSALNKLLSESRRGGGGGGRGSGSGRTSGSSNRGTSNRGTANRGTANRGTANRGTANRGTANRGTSNRGTSSRVASNRGTGSGGGRTGGTNAGIGSGTTGGTGTGTSGGTGGRGGRIPSGLLGNGTGKGGTGTSGTGNGKGGTTLGGGRTGTTPGGVLGGGQAKLPGSGGTNKGGGTDGDGMGNGKGGMGNGKGGMGGGMGNGKGGWGGHRNGGSHLHLDRYTRDLFRNLDYVSGRRSFIVSGRDPIYFSDYVSLNPGDEILRVGSYRCCNTRFNLDQLIDMAVDDGDPVMVVRDGSSGELVNVSLGGGDAPDSGDDSAPE